MSSSNETLIIENEMPFYNLSDHQFNAIIGNWSREIDLDADLYKLIPNPDKFDENDSEFMLNTPSSDYYSIDDINKMLKDAGPKALSLIHCNVRSLSKNLALLNDLISILSSKPDIIGISETKLNENSVDNIDLLGYNFYQTNSSTNAGGVGIYVSKDLISIPRPDIDLRTDCTESCWIEIDPGFRKKHLLIGCIYRHPRGNIDSFTTKLEELFEQNNLHNRYDVYIVGDINIDFFKFIGHLPTEKYLNMLYAYNFLPIITKPTRLTDYTKTLIDHIYTNAYSDQISSGILLYDISDHLPVFCTVKFCTRRTNERGMYRDYSSFNQNEYLNEIEMIDWTPLYQSDNLNEITNDVVNLLIKISNKHAPIKKVSRSKQKQLNKPWISNGILKSIKNKQRMYSTHFHSNNVEKINRYKTYANKLNYIISISKKRYFDHQFQICKNNLKDTWKLIGSLIKRKRRGEIHPDRLLRNGKMFTTPYDVANQFNTHFINVGPSLANSIPDYTNSDPTVYIHNSPLSSFVMSTVTESQVSKLFSQLNIHKASLDIPNRLIKIASKQLSVPFTFIFNTSITTGIIPDIFKISRVTPIYKNGNTTDPNNYRPISILSPFSKILEKIVHDQMLLFLEKHKILFPHQFGFRKGYSTEQAILEITDSIKTAIDQNQVTCGVFLDFSKAFDTVNHQILLSKLDKYGFRGIPHLWFTDYLTNRKQFVKVGDVESNKLEMLCGVPQGSTLGPLLFLLYINDISNCSTKLTFRIFADDTSVFYSCKNINELEIVMNEEVQALLKYCAINKLSVNFKKTSFIIFRSPKRKHIKIHLKTITQESYVKYLGVYLDEYFNWEHQIKHINIR